LRHLADTAVNERLTKWHILAVSAEALADLHGELAGRGEHECAAGFWFRFGGVVMQGVKNWQGEAGSLSGAGLGAT